MNKILSVTLISAITLVLSTGCGGTSPSPEYHNANISNDALYVKTENNEKIAHAVEKAGEKTGWKITEFKSNTLIAEKTDDGKTISSTIKFSEGFIEFSNNSDTSDLRDAIEDELNKEPSAH